MGGTSIFLLVVVLLIGAVLLVLGYLSGGTFWLARLRSSSDSLEDRDPEGKRPEHVTKGRPANQHGVGERPAR
jgi:hypothetical protein